MGVVVASRAIAILLIGAAVACVAGAQAVTLADRPVTVSVAVSRAVRKSADIMLQLEQVSTPRNASATWNMFVEMPNADAVASVETPNFAGYVTTVPNPTARVNAPKGMSMQLPEAAAALVRGAATVRVTFVPVRQAPGEVVRIGAVRLTPGE